MGAMVGVCMGGLTTDTIYLMRIPEG
jgi:hypothetical protein